MNEEIKVSINCITYNQELYIAEAIESFLMQKTNFKFEILIHDDASTDRTAEIIKEYQKKYPNMIKPIFQKENKYSKGIKVGYEYNVKRARGKYIALCEGDDYWTDPYKLQKQVDYMEKNPECTLCIHAANEVEGDTKKVIRANRPYRSTGKCKNIDFIIKGGHFVATNSILYPKDIFINPPKWYMDCPVGDYPMQIFLANEGYAYYIDEVMSTYRIRSKGSWTSTVFDNESKREEHWNQMDKMLDAVDRYTNNKYHDEIQLTKLENRFYELFIKGDYRAMKKGKYKDIYSNKPRKFKINIAMRQYLPNFIYDLIYNMWSQIKRYKYNSKIRRAY